MNGHHDEAERAMLKGVHLGVCAAIVEINRLLNSRQQTESADLILANMNTLIDRSINNYREREIT